MYILFKYLDNSGSNRIKKIQRYRKLAKLFIKMRKLVTVILFAEYGFENGSIWLIRDLALNFLISNRLFIVKEVNLKRQVVVSLKPKFNYKILPVQNRY